MEEKRKQAKTTGNVGKKKSDTKTECIPIANLIGDLVRNCQGGEAQSARAVWGLWDGVVGKTMADNAQPAAFRERTLVVHVSSSVWLQELHFQKNDLIARLNQAAGAWVVDDIRFKLGALLKR